MARLIRTFGFSGKTTAGSIERADDRRTLCLANRRSAQLLPSKRTFIRQSLHIERLWGCNMTMLLLTPAQAAMAKNIAEERYSVIRPIPLKNGNFVVPIEVLDDATHSEAKKVLRLIPTIPDPAPDEYLLARTTDRQTVP